MYTLVITVNNSPMTIREMLNESMIELGAELYSKGDALDELIRLQKRGGMIEHPKVLKREVIERENRGNTAAGCRIAICDVMHSGSAKTAVSAVTIRDGVDYGAPDKRRVKLIFMIAGKNGSNEHQRVKAQLQKLFSDPTFTAQLCAAKSADVFFTLIVDQERRFSHRYGRSKPLPYKSHY